MNAAAAISIQPTGATLGAIVTGVNLTTLTDGEWRRIDAAFLEHAVLIFPGQHLSAEAQTAFGERFGPIEQLVAGRTFVPISNRRPDGSLLSDHENGMKVMMGNEGWHTDSSYMPVSAKASVLSAQVVPADGGQTEWADMRAAYAALDDATRRQVADRCAYHSLRYSQARIGHIGATGSSYGFYDGEPPLRPLVKVHPVTGRPALYIGRHAYGIPGLDPGESEKFLDGLVAFACQPPRVYSHAWTAGDVVIWDNRCVLHRARPYDHGEARVMMHVRVAGDPQTERSMEIRHAS